MKTCTECDNPAIERAGNRGSIPTLCIKHKQARIRMQKNSPTKTCSEDGCDRPLRARGLCASHYNRTHQPERHKKTLMACDRCGKTFIREDRSNRYEGSYCTWECRSEAMWGELRLSRQQVAIYKPTPLWHRVVTGMTSVTPPSARTFVAGTCTICGASYLCLFGSKTCGDECQAIARRNQRHELKQRSRARKRNAYIAPVYRMRVFERDKWTCQLCQGPIDRNAVSPNPYAPSIDHIVPLAQGGTHEPANVQATHLLCNATKSDRTHWAAAIPLSV